MKNKLFFKICLIWSILAFFLMGAYATGSAEDVGSFYKGKVVRLIVPFSPGGGYDTYARFLANAMEKYMDCTVIVINKPGGGGFVAINYMYESARKDGLTIAMAPEGLPLAQLMGTTGVRFDCRKFGWIGSINQDVRFLSVAVDSPYKSVDDLKKLKRPKAATVSVASTAGPSLMVAIEALKMDNAKIVAGYPGSVETIIAVKRGEADFCLRATHHLLVKNSLLRPIVAVNEKRVPEFSNIPAITEYDIEPGAQRMMQIIFSGKPSERSLITPPGVSVEKISFLRKMVQTCFSDPELVKKSKKAMLLVNPVTGKEAEASIKKMFKVSPKDIEKLKYIIFKKYL